MTSPPLSGHGGVQGPAASEAAPTLPAPAPPSEISQQRRWRYTSNKINKSDNPDWVVYSSFTLGLSSRQLRASADQRLHHAVVPHHVRHLPAGVHRAEDLGLGFLRGVRGSVSSRPRHLGATGRVSGPQLELQPVWRFHCLPISHPSTKCHGVILLTHLPPSAGGSSTVRPQTSSTAPWVVSLRRCWSTTSSILLNSCRWEIN